MKKFLALLLALMMVFCLAACGSEEPAGPDVEEEAAGEVAENEDTEDPPESAQAADNTGAEISDEQLAALTEAYNQVAPLYNEAYTAAEANGWLADEQTAAEIEALNDTLGFIGHALTEDLTALDGSDFDTLTTTLQGFVPALEELVTRVSVPYEG